MFVAELVCRIMLITILFLTAPAKVSYGERTSETKHLQCAGFVGDCLVKEHQATKEGHKKYHVEYL
jgi:hypothetical protein